MRQINSKNAPQAGGHYSQAIEHAGIIYVSGQLPVYPKTGEKCLGSIEEQTRLVLHNVAAILDASNSNLNNVLKITVYISDINLWSRVNQVYAEYFGEHKPARVVVPAKDLHFGFGIEVDAIAKVNETN